MKTFTKVLWVLSAIMLSCLIGLVAAVLLSGCGGCAPHPVDGRFRRLAISSVKIERGDGGAGSGTIVKVIGDRSLILTAAHVVRGADDLRAFALGGDGPIKVLKRDDGEDLALVEACGLNEPPLPIAARAPYRYEEAWLMGSIAGYARSPGNALIANVDFPFEGRKHGMVVAVAPMSKGDSGGTLANARCELEAVPLMVPWMPEKVFAQGRDEDGDIVRAPTPFVALGNFPGIGLYASVWAIRDFLAGTEAAP